MVGNNLGEGIADPCWGKTVIFFFLKIHKSGLKATRGFPVMALDSKK